MKKINKGITLIALVVTIVVLIILAGVSISLILGENGIITKSKYGKQLSLNAEVEEREAINEMANALNLDNRPLITTVTTTNHETIKAKDEEGNTVTIPSGFKIHEDSSTKVDEGIVITDGVNEFVWVPVDNNSFKKMFNKVEPPLVLNGNMGATSNYYSNLRVANSSYDIATVINGAYSSISTIREPDLVTQVDCEAYYKGYEKAGYESIKKMAQGFVDDYKNMIASVDKYDGFYIGRYELTGTVSSPTVKEGKVLTNKSWYELYNACKSVKKNNDNVTSTMIWGRQWDETLEWIKNTKFGGGSFEIDNNSSSWGNYELEIVGGSYQNVYKNTGYSEKWSANKIYDLAGNYWELTQEAFDKYGRVMRGANSAAADRAWRYPDLNVYDNTSTRVTIYINV